jgi:hypothetical protein
LDSEEDEVIVMDLSVDGESTNKHTFTNNNSVVQRMAEALQP